MAKACQQASELEARATHLRMRRFGLFARRAHGRSQGIQPLVEFVMGCQRGFALACSGCERDNDGMIIPGRVQNGVVVLEGPMTLPEGSAVYVSNQLTPNIRLAKRQTPVVLRPVKR